MASCLSEPSREPSREPSPRWGHYSAAIRGQVYIYGGFTKKFFKRKPELAVSVHSFNQCMETWQTRTTTGKHPPGPYDGACTSSGHHLYVSGGDDGFGSDPSLLKDSLHQLDTDSLEWSELPSGPTKKQKCAMVAYKDKLILFGGYGIPSGPMQPRAQFIEHNRFTDGRGWTNELHSFDLHKGEGPTKIVYNACKRLSYLY